MHDLIEAYRKSNKPLLLCDYSPPRSPGAMNLDSLKKLPVDYFSVAYNPGKAPRVDSITAARLIQSFTSKPVIFTMAARDMNKIAIQSQLLGASISDLNNVLLVGGDPLAELEKKNGATEVRDYKPTDLIRSTAQLALGLDYRGMKIAEPPVFCIGAALDTSNNLDLEIPLMLAKIQAGAQFFITQPIYEINEYYGFLEKFKSITGSDLTVPIFWGLQVLSSDGPIFGKPTQRVLNNLNYKINPLRIARDLLQDMRSAEVKGIYLIPPISSNGRRDYPSLNDVIYA